MVDPTANDIGPAADAPELLSLIDIRRPKKENFPEPGNWWHRLVGTAVAAYDDSGRLWRDVAADWKNYFEKSEASRADLAMKLAAAERERDALHTYAHETTKAITELAGGGSELFAGQIGEMYKADLPFCTRRIRERIDRGHNVAANAVRKQHSAEAALVAAQEAMREAAAKCAEQETESYYEGMSAVDVRLSRQRGLRWKDGDQVAAAIRALPISAAKSEGEYMKKRADGGYPEAYASLNQKWLEQHRRIETLEQALRFYADPETYVAIGFFPDRPCGEFMDDFEEVDDEWGWRPGKRARAALAQTGEPTG